VDAEVTTAGMPLAGRAELLHPEMRHPGAVLDVAMAGGRLFDLLGFYSQAIGPVADRAVVPYDTAEPVRRDDAIGLRLEGSPFPNALARLETTYWILPGQARLEIESKLIGLGPDEPLPEIRDLAFWQIGGYLAQGTGLLAPGLETQSESHYVMAYNGSFTTAIEATSGTLSVELDKATRHMGVRLNESQRDGDAVLLTARRLRVNEGHFASMTPLVEDLASTDTGMLRGVVRAAGIGLLDQAQEISLFTVKRVEPDNLQSPLAEEPKLYTIIQTDLDGRYETRLPAGLYAIVPGEVARPVPGRLTELARVAKDQTTERNVLLGDVGQMFVRVVDDATSRPMAARLRLTPIAPTPNVNFGIVESNRRYLDYVQIDEAGSTVTLPAGLWTINAYRGPEYDAVELTAQAVPHRPAIDDAPELHPETYELRLKRSCPTPGWQSLSVGLMTDATPGCMLTARDAVRMADIEGLEWVVSGDFETITDLEPVIRDLGLEGRLRSMRGFRTMLPAHPEWGPLMVFPVAADAPDPRLARKDWAALETTGEWLAALRKNYPGALIQADLPWTPSGRGYFAQGETNPLVAVWETKPGIDLSIDLVNLVPARAKSDVKMMNSFWNTLLMRGLRIGASVSEPGRMAMGGQPGYPRLLVHVHEDDPARVTPETIVKNLRALHVQVTTGPFVELVADGLLPGDRSAANPELEVRLRVSAANWIDVKDVALNKEGAFHAARTSNSDAAYPQRWPDPIDTELKFETFGPRLLRLSDEKDTLLGALSLGFEPLTPAVPSVDSAAESIYPLAIIAPIAYDGNGNGQYDPLTVFGDRGL
jgi:hypothetical protein